MADFNQYNNTYKQAIITIIIINIKMIQKYNSINIVLVDNRRFNSRFML